MLSFGLHYKEQKSSSKKKPEDVQQRILRTLKGDVNWKFMKCSQHIITPALKCEPRRRKVAVSQNKTFPSRSVEILSPGCWNPCPWEYSAPSTPRAEVKCWHVDVNSRMVFGDVSHEEGGGSKTMSPSELGFLQAERSESAKMLLCLKSSTRAFHKQNSTNSTKIIYIYVSEEIYDTSKARNKERLFLLVMHEVS